MLISTIPTTTPGGQINPKKFVFPYADSSFDLVFLTSVFTHMLPEDVKRYMEEISRVLKSGGRSVVTYFLVNPPSTEVEGIHPLARAKSRYSAAGLPPRLA